MEAQAAGVSVISTGVGGIESVVDDGQMVLLVEPGDDTRFAAELERCLADEALRRRLGKSGSAHVQVEFSLSRLVDKIDALYRRLLADALQYHST
jgi:L-malate glycosyltransferase